MGRPKCPNHTVEMDPTDNRRNWICPVSGAQFEADVDDASSELKVDLNGNDIENWKVTGTDE